MTKPAHSSKVSAAGHMAMYWHGTLQSSAAGCTCTLQCHRLKCNQWTNSSSENGRVLLDVHVLCLNWIEYGVSRPVLQRGSHPVRGKDGFTQLQL